MAGEFQQELGWHSREKTKCGPVSRAETWPRASRASLGRHQIHAESSDESFCQSKDFQTVLDKLNQSLKVIGPN